MTPRRLTALLLLGALVVFVGCASTDPRAVRRGVPTIGVAACGSSPEGTASGTDGDGMVLIGGGVVERCTLTFSSKWPRAPMCIVIRERRVPGLRNRVVHLMVGVAPTLTTLTMIVPASFQGERLVYSCRQDVRQ